MPVYLPCRYIVSTVRDGAIVHVVLLSDLAPLNDVLREVDAVATATQRSEIRGVTGRDPLTALAMLVREDEIGHQQHHLSRFESVPHRLMLPEVAFAFVNDGRVDQRALSAELMLQKSVDLICCESLCLKEADAAVMADALITSAAVPNRATTIADIVTLMDDDCDRLRAHCAALPHVLVKAGLVVDVALSAEIAPRAPINVSIIANVSPRRRPETRPVSSPPHDILVEFGILSPPPQQRGSGTGTSFGGGAAGSRPRHASPMRKGHEGVDLLAEMLKSPPGAKEVDAISNWAVRRPVLPSWLTVTRPAEGAPLAATSSAVGLVP